MHTYTLDTNNSILKIPELETKNRFVTLDSGLWQVIGDLDQSIFLQQIWYWFSNPKNGLDCQDGQRWIWKSIREFKAEVFPGWSETKIRRVRDSLCDRELLVADNKFSEHCKDRAFSKNRTLWYRLNLDKLTSLIDRFIGKNKMAESTETGRSATLGETVPPLNAKQDKEYITEKTIEKNNIEQQNDFSDLKKNSDDLLDQTKPPLAFASNLEETNKQKQEDQSQALHKNNTSGAALRNVTKQDNELENVLIKPVAEKPRLPKKVPPSESKTPSSIEKESQPIKNEPNNAVKLKARKMYQNFNNTGGIAPGDDINDPELIGRKYNQQKGTYGSRASDPWMMTRNAILPEFVAWLLRTREQQGQDYGLANLKAEIRNNYVRADDLWQDYLFGVNKQNTRSNAKFGSPLHEITMESMDAWVTETSDRINREKSNNEGSKESIDWGAELEKKAELQRQREECQKLAQEKRIEAEKAAQNAREINAISERESDLKKLEQLEKLNEKHPGEMILYQINKIKSRLKAVNEI